MSNCKIYIDIQSLMDLRHSALFHMLGQEGAHNIVLREPYNLREHDQIPEIDLELFEAYLNSTDTRMLATAPMTYLQVPLASKVQNLEKRNSFMGEVAVPEIVLNTYPFTLTAEQAEVFQNALFLKTGSSAKVTLVFEHPKGLTPHYLKNTGFAACFMYDFSQWAGYHTKAVESGDLREVLMYFPALYKVPPTEEERKVFQKLGFKDIFQYTEYLFTARVPLQFLPVFFYSSLVTATAFLELHKDHLQPEHGLGPKDKL